MNVTDEILVQKVKSGILSVDKDAEVILFGSRARGDAREDSDWDFLCLTSLRVNDSLRMSVIKEVYPIELEEEVVVQVVIKNKIDWETKYVDSPFYLNVKDDGISL